MHKLTRNEAITILKDFIEKELPKIDWYKNIQPHIKAIMFYGSTAKETNKPDSDIDLYIILPLKIEEKYTKGEYFFQFQNREINIVLRSIERLRKLAQEKSEFEKEVFRKSEILREKDKEVRELISKF